MQTIISNVLNDPKVRELTELIKMTKIATDLIVMYREQFDGLETIPEEIVNDVFMPKIASRLRCTFIKYATQVETIPGITEKVARIVWPKE